jgi:hypothetical protein
VLCGGPNQDGGGYYDAQDGRTTQLVEFDPVESAKIEGGFQIPFIDGAPEKLKLGFGFSGSASTGTHDGGASEAKSASWLV